MGAFPFVISPRAFPGPHSESDRESRPLFSLRLRIRGQGKEGQSKMKVIDRVYRPRLDEFIKALAKYPCSDYTGIPHPFLPEIGKNYRLALKRIAIVGKETRGWKPDLDEFIPSYLNYGFDFADEMAEFRNLDFKDSGWMGGVPTRASFWGFWMNVLAKVYGVVNWKDIQHGKFDILLDSFAWGNVNSIETSTSASVNANASGYYRAKAMSAKLFDSIDLLVQSISPHVVILMCSNAERDRYLGLDFRMEERAEDKVSVFKRDNLVVFHLPHPNKQRWCPGGADEFASIIRNLLVKYKMFCPLPNVFKNGLKPEARDILVRECIGMDKYDAIAKTALELRRQYSYMSARDLCLKILNSAGIKNDRGEPFSGNTRGPCRLVSTAWNHFQNVTNQQEVAEAIALAFTNVSGRYAYEC